MQVVPVRLVFQANMNAAQDLSGGGCSGSYMVAVACKRLATKSSRHGAFSNQSASTRSVLFVFLQVWIARNFILSYKAAGVFTFNVAASCWTESRL